jgi:hypothetical protein
VIAWPLRYVVFAIGTPALKALVLASLGLHGIGYTFFFVVAFIYVDKVAPKDIRASAQSLFTLATLGVGNFLGTLFTGQIIKYYTDTKPAADGGVNWTPLFYVPCALTVVCAIAFLLFFRDPRAEAGASASGGESLPEAG